MRTLWNSIIDLDEVLESSYGTLENMALEMDLDLEDMEEYELYDILQRELDYQYEDLMEIVQGERTEGEIIVFADLGLWDGRQRGHKKIGYDLRDIFYSDNDRHHWFLGLHDLQYVGVHHDGRNYYRYREIKPNLSERQLDNMEDKLFNGAFSKADMTRYTRSLRPTFEKILDY